MRLALVLFVLLSTLRGQAVPADEHLTLEPGTERFYKPTFRVEGAFAEPSEGADVDPLPSNDLYVQVSPTFRGPLLVFAYSAYRVHVYSVCVAGPGEEKVCPAPVEPSAAAKACPGFGKASEDGKPVWKGELKDGACLESLLSTLRHARIPAGDLRLTMNETSARAHFAAVGEQVKKRPELANAKVSFLGPTFVFSGKATRPAFESLLSLAWHRSLGSVSYEAEKLTIEEVEPLPPPQPEPVIKLPEVTDK